MEKVNAMPLYWLALSIGTLQSQMTPTASIGSLIQPLTWARGNIEYFSGNEGLPLSKDAALGIITILDKIFTADRLQNPNTIIPKEELDMFNFAIYNFQAVLGTELPRANFFYITPKRAYDMTMLINKGESVLAPEIIDLLGESKEEAIRDIREATKAMAFDLSTAVGFHIYRAVEAIIVKDYFPVLEIMAEEWEKNPNLGNYIKLLIAKHVDNKVTIILNHLKDHYRNPIFHPEEFWDSKTAETALGLAVSAIIIMVKDINNRTCAEKVVSS